jgi:hypothetical protein
MVVHTDVGDNIETVFTAPFGVSTNNSVFVFVDNLLQGVSGAGSWDLTQQNPVEVTFVSPPPVGAEILIYGMAQAEDPSADFRKEFDATALQTEFNLDWIVNSPDEIMVFVSNVLQPRGDGTDWSLTASNPGQITFSPGLPVNTRVDVIRRGGPRGLSGGGFSSTTWTSEVDDLSAPPSPQSIEWNNATQSSATQLFIDYDDNTGTDISTLLASMTIGSRIRIQRADDINTAQIFNVTGKTDNTTYYTFDVTNISATGLDIPGGNSCFVTLLNIEDMPAHSSSHEVGGDDTISHDNIADYDVAQHRIIDDVTPSTTTLYSGDKIEQIATSITSGLKVKPSVDTSTYGEGNITLSAEQTLNGLLTSTSDVLVVEQTLPEENGIYTTAAGAWTRRADYDTDAEVNNGDLIYVINSGSTKNAFKYILATQDPITVGSTGLSYMEHPDLDFGSTAGTITEGNDSRLPTQDENDALVGTGTPSSGNVYVTEDTHDLHKDSTANPHSVTKAQTGLGNVENLKVNLTAIIAPVVTDDSSSGYAVGSRWIDVTGNEEYVCLDASVGAAVWEKTTAGAEFKLRVSATDTTEDYLDSKVSAGLGMTKSILNPAADEDLEIEMGPHYLSLASSGLYSGAVLSAGASTGTFDLTSGEGFTNDSSLFPTVSPVAVTISSRTNESLPDILTQPVTYIMVATGDVLLKLSSFPTPEQRRDNIFIGVVVHSDNVNVNAVNNTPDVGMDVSAQVHDIMKGLGFFNLDGNIISENGSNLSINKSAGKAFKGGANFSTNTKDPHTLTLGAQIAATFRYRNQDSSEGSDITLIDPTTYDNGGVTTAIAGSNNQATIQRIYIFPSGIIRVQRGQEVFSSFSVAVDALGHEEFVVESNIDENGLLLASLVVTKGTTDLSSSTATFFIASRFGELGSVGSSSTTTLQQAWDNSIDPEITTDSTRGAFTVRRGSTADSDIVVEVQNGAGTNVLTIDGLGNVTLSGTLDGRDIATDGSALDAHLIDTANPHSVTKAQVGLGDVENLKVNLSGVVAPVATDDSGSGYSIGSRWYDIVADEVYECFDATVSAAVWKKASNQTHTGEVTGSTTLTVDPTAITNKGTVIPESGDFVLISDTSDSGNLKKVDVSDLIVSDNTYSETLLTANWVLDAGTTYYQDVTHNLGTLDLLKTFRDTADDSDVIVEAAIATDSNTVRVKIEGNTTEVRVILTSGISGTIKENTAVFTSLNSDTNLNTTTHKYIKVDTSGGDVTLTLPLSANGLYSYDIWKTTSDTNKVIISRAGSDTIIGSTTFEWDSQWAHYEFVPDTGTLWLVK